MLLSMAAFAVCAARICADGAPVASVAGVTGSDEIDDFFYALWSAWGAARRTGEDVGTKERPWNEISAHVTEIYYWQVV